MSEGSPATAPHSAALTFVTVVFDAEIGFLELQAASVRRCLDIDDAAAIIVLDNTVSGLSRRTLRRLEAAYGPLWPRVEVVRTDALIDARAATGWRSQQAAKLAVAARIRTPHYVVLDAKNHFTRRVGRDAFIGRDGRAHGAFHGYEGHPLRSSLEHTVAYLGGDADAAAAAVRSFPPTATPFVIDTAVVRALIADIETTSGIGFGAEFERQELLEFFLYSAWLEVRGDGAASAVDGQSIPSPTVWPRLATPAGVRATIEEARRDDAFVFAVHRQALVRADAEATALLVSFWIESGLFADRSDARAFVRRFRRAYYPALLKTRASERLRQLTRRRPTAPRAA